MNIPTHHFAAEFSAVSESVADSVVYEGKVFQAGDYPDKAFAIDEMELAQKARAFQGVDLDLEHSSFKDVLGNRLGRLEAIWNHGADAIGRLRIPKWLHELAGGKLQTSLSFDRNKNIVGCALTLNPRITDAKVVAAFSLHSPLKEKPSMPTSLKDRLRVLFGSAPEALREAGIDPHELDSVEFADRKPEIDPSIQSQLAEFKATNDRLLATQLNIAATVFADDMVRNAKAVPAQHPHLVALYKAAALADGEGMVRFTDNGKVQQGVNLKALEDLFKDAQPHNLFSTQIPNADPTEDSNAPNPAMVERLRGATSLGLQTTKREGK